jgi:hypothetical protein
MGKGPRVLTTVVSLFGIGQTVAGEGKLADGPQSFGCSASLRFIGPPSPWPHVMVTNNTGDKEVSTTS